MLHGYSLTVSSLPIIFLFFSFASFVNSKRNNNNYSIVFFRTHTVIICYLMFATVSPKYSKYYCYYYLSIGQYFPHSKFYFYAFSSYRNEFGVRIRKSGRWIDGCNILEEIDRNVSKLGVSYPHTLFVCLCMCGVCLPMVISIQLKSNFHTRLFSLLFCGIFGFIIYFGLFLIRHKSKQPTRELHWIISCYVHAQSPQTN